MEQNLQLCFWLNPNLWWNSRRQTSSTQYSMRLGLLSWISNILNDNNNADIWQKQRSNSTKICSIFSANFEAYPQKSDFIKVHSVNYIAQIPSNLGQMKKATVFETWQLPPTQPAITTCDWKQQLVLEIMTPILTPKDTCCGKNGWLFSIKNNCSSDELPQEVSELCEEVPISDSKS